MAALPLCRSALRRSALPIGVGLTSGFLFLHRQRPMRFDALNPEPIGRRQFSSDPKHTQGKEILSPEVIKQLSGGSVAGGYYANRGVIPTDRIARLHFWSSCQRIFQDSSIVSWHWSCIDSGTEQARARLFFLSLLTTSRLPHATALTSLNISNSRNGSNHPLP